MIYVSHYNSPIGEMVLASKDDKLIGVWFADQKNVMAKINEKVVENDQVEILKTCKKWLDKYFKGEKVTGKEVKIALMGTDFQKCVWE